MKLSVHGGGCCGVKHLFGFGIKPSIIQAERKLPLSASLIKEDLFQDEFPQETARERFHRYVDHQIEKQSFGMLEVTLVSEYDPEKGIESPPPAKNWWPILRRKGFQEGPSFWNSNSGNRVTVFYLLYGQPEDE